jgi:hypothetical protein
MRTFEQIYGEINEAQRAEQVLTNLNSTSQTSIWGLIKKMFALLIRLFEVRVETFKTDILKRIDEQEKGDLYYYVSKAKCYQHGDNFNIERFGITYPVIDLDKRLIAQASANEVTDGFGTKILLKIAKTDSSGKLQKLLAAEILSFQNYLNYIRFAGVRVEIRSIDAEILKLNLTVKLNKSVCNAAGTLIVNPSFKPVESAISAFIQNLPFDSQFRWRELETYLMTLESVMDCSITSSSVAGVVFVMSTISEAGYYSFDTTSVISYV